MAMKNAKVLYWIVTGLAAALMVMSSIPDVLRNPQALSIFEHLGYPDYLLPFLGIAKLLGVTALVVPGLRQLKEWAYAGLVFDLSGALYSHLSVGDPSSVWVFPIIGLGLVGGSYLLRPDNGWPVELRLDGGRSSALHVNEGSDTW